MLPAFLYVRKTETGVGGACKLAKVGSGGELGSAAWSLLPPPLSRSTAHEEGVPESCRVIPGTAGSSAV